MFLSIHKNTLTFRGGLEVSSIQTNANEIVYVLSSPITPPNKCKTTRFSPIVSTFINKNLFVNYIKIQSAFNVKRVLKK